MDRYLACSDPDCEWTGHHSEADRAGMDRACPECGSGLRLQDGGQA